LPHLVPLVEFRVVGEVVKVEVRQLKLVVGLRGWLRRRQRCGPSIKDVVASRRGIVESVEGHGSVDASAAEDIRDDTLNRRIGPVCAFTAGYRGISVWGTG
jgi:hypothetical protein